MGNYITERQRYEIELLLREKYTKPKIAKVNKKGKLTALKPGKAVIKAKIKNGKTLKFKITIKKVSKNKK